MYFSQIPQLFEVLLVQFYFATIQDRYYLKSQLFLNIRIETHVIEQPV